MRICIPIRENNLEKTKKQVRRAKKAARGMKEVYLEIWLDEISADVIFANAGIYPIIAVCRGPIEHGSFMGLEKEKIERLKNAVSAGAKFVDVGIHTNPSLIKNLKKICSKKHAKLIISMHIWGNTPHLPYLEKLALKAKKLGADMVKIATFVKQWEDNVILFELTRRLKKRGLKPIIIGMGEKGKISRIGCPFLGSYLTYVALDKKSKTALGQLTIREAKNFRW